MQRFARFRQLPVCPPPILNKSPAVVITGHFFSLTWSAVAFGETLSQKCCLRQAAGPGGWEEGTMKWPLLLLLTCRLITVPPFRVCFILKCFFFFHIFAVFCSHLSLVCRVGAKRTAIDCARADFAAWTQLIVVLRKSHLDIWPSRNMRSADIWFSSSSASPYTGLAAFCHQQGQLSPAALAPCFVLVFPHKCAHARTKSQVLWNLPTDIHDATEAESDHCALNIGHVFTPRNQSQIPDMQ